MKRKTKNEKKKNPECYQVNRTSTIDTFRVLPDLRCKTIVPTSGSSTTSHLRVRRTAQNKREKNEETHNTKN
jgi:hypothetical protein